MKHYRTSFLDETQENNMISWKHFLDLSKKSYTTTFHINHCTNYNK